MRNQDTRIWLTVSGLLIVAATLAGFSIATAAGILVLAVTLAFAGAGLLLYRKRNRQIQALSEELNRLLHEDYSIRFDDYQEGDLAILANELSKVTIRLKEQAESLGKEKRQLADSIADISHQIRTPLTSLNLLLAAVGKKELAPEEQRKKLFQAKRLTGQIEWLIEALLKLAKLDAGSVVFEQQKVCVKELVKAAVEPLLVPMELREQQLTLELAEDAVYSGDFAWSKEALGNVLKNSVEHIGDGGTIHIRATQNVIYTELVVSDDGPGIATEDLPHLFERFYKGKYAGEQSVGIGLALARAIVVQQNGTI
ncbi:MAG: HAMP domain-containing histidine kinase, partial [Lachnospiraceae bacterium]|nr:HAMP domain-containing histidine kinase [Lachnospiraceae bacterium]